MYSKTLVFATIAVIVLITTLIAGLTAGLGACLYSFLALLVLLVGLIYFVGAVVYWVIMTFSAEHFVTQYVQIGGITHVFTDEVTWDLRDEICRIRE